MAQITLDLSEWQALQGQISTLQNALATAKDETDKLRLAGPDGADKAALLKALRSALGIVQFAVANLDPETVRGWPFPALLHLAASLSDAPGLSAVERELAPIFEAFAKECGALERLRAEGREKELETARRGSAG